MSRALEEYKDIYAEFLKRARDLIVNGHWHIKDNRLKFRLKKEDFDHVQNATEAVVDALAALIESVEGERDKPGVQPYIKEIVSTVNIHLERIKKYYPKNDPQTFQSNDNKREEGIFQQHIFKGENKIRSKIRTLNVENDMESVIIDFFDKALATIPMKEVLCQRSDKIAAKVESLDVDWDLIMDNGIFINMKKRDIPDYNSERHFWDQDLETLQFWISEYNKIKHGVTIDGYKMTPSLYFHICFFKTPIKNMGNKITNPPLRDNEWYFDEIKKYAKEKASLMERAGIIIYGTRRFSKTTQEASHVHHGILTSPTETGTVSSSNAEDLSSIVDKLKKSLDYIVPAFRIGINSGKAFDEEVLFGIKSSSGRSSYEHFTLRIINTDSGSKKGNQKTAGGNPKVFVSDEIGKSTFIKTYEAAVPSFESDEGWVCIPIYTGCLTKGNKVFTKAGDLINIEDLKKSDGIVGYNKFTQETSFEDITHINPPQSKECYYLETNKGSKIECSFDHPLLIKQRNKTEGYIDNEGNKKRRRKLEFLAVENIEIGMQISIPDIIPLKGNKNMKDPYYIGLLIGDGNYSGDRGIRFYNEDPEIWEYIDSIGKKYNLIGGHTTKEGKEYKEVRFYGGMSSVRDVGIYGQSKERKDLPKGIHLYSKDTITQLLAGLYDTDGCVYISSVNRNDNRITLASVSEKMIDSTKTLLLRLGIHTNKYFEKPRIGGVNPTNGKRIVGRDGHFVLSIQDNKSKKIFCNSIPLKVKTKKEKLRSILNIISGLGDKTDLAYPGVRFERVVKVVKVGIKPVYNLTTNKTHTYLSNGIITHNTGGDEDLSADAEKVLLNPTNFGFLEMDYDILEYGVPKEAITWQRKRFGWFIPAQMSTYTGMRKIETNFADFLGIKSEELSKIKFYKTDWVYNKKKIEEIRSKLTGTSLTSEKVFRPIDSDECFMSAKTNPFPADGIKRHKELLISETNDTTGPGIPITLKRDKIDSSKISFDITKGKMAEYPHTGGFVDSPGLLFEDFPTVQPPRFRYIAGFDDYKHEQSDGDSVSGFVIFDRIERRVVYSLAARPDPHGYLHSQVHMALDAWNAICFPENEDMKIKEYFDRQHVTHLYLATGFDPYGAFAKFSNSNRKYGWQPDKYTAPFVRNLVVDYAKEILVEGEGEQGYKRIKDIYLLEEMIKYKEGGNFDRVVGLGSALLYDYYLTSKHVFAKMPRPEQEEKPENSRGRPPKNKYFTSTRRSLF